MKKILVDKLMNLNADIKAFEQEYPISFPIMVDYKIMTAKRELLTELLQSIKK